MKKLCLILFIPLLFNTCTTSDDDSIANEENPYEQTVKIEVDFFSTGATYSLHEGNQMPQVFSDSEFNAEFSSVAGSSEWEESGYFYNTTFDNPEVLGKLIRGEMIIGFTDDFEAIGIFVDQSRQYESIFSGEVDEFFEIQMIGIPFYDGYYDDISGLSVSVYRLEGISVCDALSASVGYSRNFDAIVNGATVDAVETLDDLSCGERSYVEVRVFVPGGVK